MVDAHSKTTNNLEAPVPKFCLALEKNRRTPDGRIRSERDFREYFFPYDDNSATDRILCHLPKEVRGPVIASWGIRGQKAALRDDDQRVRMVVHDALVAGDIDDQMFEDGLESETVVGWLDLADWWTFWRGGKHTKHSIQQALENGYALGLFDAHWFFEIIESPGGRLKGTDVVTEGLSKAELSDWIKKIHASGDGSPTGLIAALGWTTVVARTGNDVLLSVIDKMAIKNDLAKSGGGEPRRSVRPAAAAGSDASGGTGWSFPPAARDGETGQQARSEAGQQVRGDAANAFAAAAALGTEVTSVSTTENGGTSADWLENPVSLTSSEAGDDLDVLVESVRTNEEESGGDDAVAVVEEAAGHEADAHDPQGSQHPASDSDPGASGSRFKLPGIPVLAKRKGALPFSPSKR